MFRELAEEIRLEAEGGRYVRSGNRGRYDVDDRPKSHLAKLWGGIKKVAKGSVGVSTLGNVHIDSVEDVNGILMDIRNALAEGRTKADQYRGMYAQHPDKWIRDISSGPDGRQRAAGLAQKAKDRKNQLAPQLVRALRRDRKIGKVIR